MIPSVLHSLCLCVRVSLAIILSAQAVCGEAAPVTTLRQPDYCASVHGPHEPKSEREEARGRERERLKEHKLDKTLQRTIREVDILRERARGRKERMEGGGPCWEGEEIDWEVAKMAASLPLRHMERGGGGGGVSIPAATVMPGDHIASARGEGGGRKGPAKERDVAFDNRERSLMALGARLRVRRAHALQVCAFALLKESYLKSEHAKERLQDLSARCLKYSAALCAYKLQVDNELEARTRTAAARHFRGWMMRACIRGWCAFVAELYRGLEAASMSARYRAMEACNIWLYSLDFNRRLRTLPVAATNPLGVNGWLARVPIAKMPAVLLEDQVMRILQHALAGWQEVLEDEQKTQGMRGKWREHRIRQGLPFLPPITPLHTSPFIPITCSLSLLSTPPPFIPITSSIHTHTHACHVECTNSRC